MSTVTSFAWWLLMNSAAKAKLFLEKLHLKRDQVNVLHEVLSVHESMLAMVLRECIRTGNMDPTLRYEIYSIKLCSLDDTMGETPDRDISNEFRRTVGSSFVSLVAHLRQTQNLELWGSLSSQSFKYDSISKTWDSCWVSKIVEDSTRFGKPRWKSLGLTS